MGSSEFCTFEAGASFASESPDPFSPAGEMGIVSSGTGEVGLPLLAGAADASREAMAG